MEEVLWLKKVFLKNNFKTGKMESVNQKSLFQTHEKTTVNKKIFEPIRLLTSSHRHNLLNNKLFCIFYSLTKPIMVKITNGKYTQDIDRKSSKCTNSTSRDRITPINNKSLCSIM